MTSNEVMLDTAFIRVVVTRRQIKFHLPSLRKQMVVSTLKKKKGGGVFHKGEGVKGAVLNIL